MRGDDLWSRDSIACVRVSLVLVAARALFGVVQTVWLGAAYFRSSVEMVW